MVIDFTADKMEKIPSEEIQSWVGRKVHVKWAKRGCVWRILKVIGDEVLLETPKTDKKILARIDDLRKLRADSDDIYVGLHKVS